MSVHISVDFGILAAFVLAALASKRLWKKWKYSLTDIDGPASQSPSFILGNLPEILQREVGDPEFEWQSKYGKAYRYKGCLGEDRLMISDPKALQYIYSLDESFSRPGWVKAAASRGVGKGLLVAEGDAHKRQRKIMQPAFSPAHVRDLFPVFSRVAHQLESLWTNQILRDSSNSSVIDVSQWLTRATLDALGIGAFDYQFGSLDDQDNELAKSYQNLLYKIWVNPSNMFIFFQQAIVPALPLWIIEIVLNLPIPKFQGAYHNFRLTTKVAKQLIDQKREAKAMGLDEGKDVLGLLVDANEAASSSAKMSEEEMLAQMTTLMFAGHETTASAMSWCLLELARHPEMQQKLRAEIQETQLVAQEHDDDPELSDDEASGMPYLNAVIKEVLRFHPGIYLGLRVALKDEVIPLSGPIKTRSGKYITEIPVAAGQTLSLNIASYQRLKDIWGDDADIFRPERWLERPKEKLTIGVYSNLLTFGTGYRPCIGWRFTVLELQALLITLLPAFEFSVPDDGPRIVRMPSAVMTPAIDGQWDKGGQLPLKVTRLTT